MSRKRHRPKHAAAPTPLPRAGHADGDTTRPETPALEGRTPMSPEITGRAAGTDDDLVSLFANGSSEHLADGFHGGSDDEHATPDATRPDVAAVHESRPE